MSDPATLLRSLLRVYIPDEKHPFRNLSDFSFVVDRLRTHKLLSEHVSLPMQQESMDAWKLAVDSWVHRLLGLASCDVPEKCWAGICLLGLTCQECEAERFVASYSVWLHQLLSNIKAPAAPHFLKAAACASISDLLTRLSGFSNSRKDGVSLATGIIQPVLNLLNNDSSTILLEDALILLCTMIILFPSSVYNHYESVEAAIVSNIMYRECSDILLEKLAYALSMLPKSKGDESGWALMMDKIMLFINNQLTDAFQGLEEEDKSTYTMKALLPLGKESPPPFCGLAACEESGVSTRRPERLLGSKTSTLMLCCCNMLTNSYSVMVPVPASGLIALVRRVLMVEVPSSPFSSSFMTLLKQELVIPEIPPLQLRSLEILNSLIKGVGSQLLPYVSGIVQLLNGYLKRCKLPDLRIKAYSTLKSLLSVGVAIHISQDVINIVSADLDFSCKHTKNPVSQSSVTGELSNGSLRKKRKLSSLAKEPPSHNGAEAEISHHSTPVSLKIAALELLEALFNVGGSMRSEQWRGDVDRLLIVVATDACKGRTSLLPGDNSAPVSEAFQLAALRALRASLLSASRIAPSHLALALNLFREGILQRGSQLSEFCRSSLPNLEPLIHPRALPLLDLHPNNNDWKPSSNIPFGQSGKGMEEPESDDDDLGNDVEWEEIVHHTEKPSPSPSAAAKGITMSSQNGVVAAMVSSPDAGPSVVADGVRATSSGVDHHITAASDCSRGVESMELEEAVCAMATEKKSVVEPEEEREVAIPSGITVTVKSRETWSAATTVLERISATLENAEGKWNSLANSETDDLLPDIVDGDPDSD